MTSPHATDCPGPPRRRWWLVSPWPLLFALGGGASLWMLAVGDPFEPLELQGLGQIIRWRHAAGRAPAVDPHIVDLDISAEDLREMPSLADEYRLAGQIAREAADLGARVVAFDVIYERGNPEIARPLLDAIASAGDAGTAVVLAEARRAPSEPPARSFPFTARHLPAGLINVQADADGVFRRYEMFQAGAAAPEPSLALSAYLAWKGVSWQHDVTFPEAGLVNWPELGADDASITTRTVDARPRLLDFRAGWEDGGPAAFRHLGPPELRRLDDAKSAAEQDAAARDAATSRPLDGCILLVSYVGAGIGDTGATPFGANQPKVALHATALNDLIQGTSLRRATRQFDALCLALLIPFGWAAGRPRRRTTRGACWLLVTTGLLAAGVGAVWYARLVPGTMAAVAVWTGLLAADGVRRRAMPPEGARRSAVAPRDVPAAPGVPLEPCVFISSKSEDYPHARTVYEFLRARGIPAFFSQDSLPRLASSNYRREIDKAIDAARHMIVVASSVGNVTSTWVEAEWGIFVNEQRSGRKTGNLLTVAVGALDFSALPPALRSQEVIVLDDEAFPKILCYVGDLAPRK